MDLDAGPDVVLLRGVCAVNLTDEGLRAVRSAATTALETHSDPTMPETILALVEEVERLRELLESASGEDIARDVQERIDALQADDADIRWRRLASALSITAAKAIANGRWAVEENRRATALAAKAEAGKELYEALLWHREQIGHAWPQRSVAALDRWEAANAE